MSATALIAFGTPIALALLPALLAAGRGRRAWLWFGVAWGSIGLGVGLSVELGAWAAVLGGLLGWAASLSLLFSLPAPQRALLERIGTPVGARRRELAGSAT